MAKKYLSILLICAVWLCPLTGHASSTADDYRAALAEYTAALAALAAYDDRPARTAKQQLEDSGWHFTWYQERFYGVNARYSVIRNSMIEPGRDVYMLAITGTENFKDMMVDIKTSRTLFGGTTSAEFMEYAAKLDVTSKDPLVHKGFNRYTQAAFFAVKETGFTYGEHIVNLLRDNPDRKLYLVGHSLGGAVATLGAARLISLGVDPQQLAVITFGAPAVGNRVFARQYGAAVDLTRVVIKGDPIKDMLQGITGGAYTQFGVKKEWRENPTARKPRHSVLLYLDAAMRQYYDARRAMLDEGLTLPEERLAEQRPPSVYVAPVKFEIIPAVLEDKFYLRETARTGISSSSQRMAFGEDEQRATVEQELAKARVMGCQWLIMPMITVKRQRQHNHSFHVGYEETIYNAASGDIEALLMNNSGTRDFTLLEANMYNVMELKEQRDAILTRQAKPQPGES